MSVNIPDSVLRLREAQATWLGRFLSPTLHPSVPQIPRAVARARIDVLRPTELLDRLAARWRDPQSSVLIDRLVDADLTRRQQGKLLSMLTTVIEASETVPAKERLRGDRLVYRVLFRIGDPAAFEFAVRCLKHPCTPIRKAAYRYFSTRKVPAAMAGTLVDHFHASMRQEPLEVLARSPEAVNEVETASLLSALEKRYWRMRVIEGMLLRGDSLGEEITSRYAIEYVWASARQPRITDWAVMRRLLDENRREPEFVRWYIWALGKLRAKRELRMAWPLAEELMKSAGMSVEAD